MDHFAQMKGLLSGTVLKDTVFVSDVVCACGLCGVEMKYRAFQSHCQSKHKLTADVSERLSMFQKSASRWYAHVYRLNKALKKSSQNGASGRKPERKVSAGAKRNLGRTERNSPGPSASRKVFVSAHAVDLQSSLEGSTGDAEMQRSSSTPSDTPATRGRRSRSASKSPSGQRRKRGETAGSSDLEMNEDSISYDDSSSSDSDTSDSESDGENVPLVHVRAGHSAAADGGRFMPVQDPILVPFRLSYTSSKIRCPAEHCGWHVLRRRFQSHLDSSRQCLKYLRSRAALYSAIQRDIKSQILLFDNKKRLLVAGEESYFANLHALRESRLQGGDGGQVGVGVPPAAGAISVGLGSVRAPNASQPASRREVEGVASGDDKCEQDGLRRAAAVEKSTARKSDGDADSNVRMEVLDDEVMLIYDSS